MTSILKMLSAALTIPCIFFGCAGGPTKPDHIDNKRTVSIPFDQAWVKVQQRLGASGFPVASSSKEAGTISTAKKTARLDTADADCGSYMGFDYLGDSRTVTTVTYSVFLQAVGAQTEITADTTIEGTYQASAGKTNVLNCFSKGRLERTLLDSIK